MANAECEENQGIPVLLMLMIRTEMAGNCYIFSICNLYMLFVFWIVALYNFNNYESPECWKIWIPRSYQWVLEKKSQTEKLAVKRFSSDKRENGAFLGLDRIVWGSWEKLV